MTIVMFGGKRGRQAENIIPTLKHGGGSIMLSGALLQEGLVHITK
jgi:hypothetical protein